MVTQELLTYIASRIKQEEKTSIVQRLLATGWREADIIQAFSFVNPPTAVTQTNEKSKPTIQMEQSDFWTHICTVIIAFVTTVLPGSITYGFTQHTLIYVCGATAVILLAIVWRAAKL